jgi:hypothetical protein
MSACTPSALSVIGATWAMRLRRIRNCTILAQCAQDSQTSSRRTEKKAKKNKWKEEGSEGDGERKETARNETGKMKVRRLRQSMKEDIDAAEMLSGAAVAAVDAVTRITNERGGICVTYWRQGLLYYYLENIKHSGRLFAFCTSSTCRLSQTDESLIAILWSVILVHCDVFATWPSSVFKYCRMPTTDASTLAPLLCKPENIRNICL